MIHYHKILELHDEDISLRGIAARSNSCQKVTETIGLAEKKDLIYPLDEKISDLWIEDFFYLEKVLDASGRQPLSFVYIHKGTR